MVISWSRGGQGVWFLEEGGELGQEVLNLGREGRFLIII